MYLHCRNLATKSNLGAKNLKSMKYERFFPVDSGQSWYVLTLKYRQFSNIVSAEKGIFRQTVLKILQTNSKKKEN